MNKSKKAALFSGVIFPGAGYFFLGSTVRGYWTLACTLLLITLLVCNTFYKVFTTVQAFAISGQIATDIGTLIVTIRDTPGLFSEYTQAFIFILFVVVWAVSIIDCYRLGKKVKN